MHDGNVLLDPPHGGKMHDGTIQRAHSWKNGWWQWSNGPNSWKKCMMAIIQIIFLYIILKNIFFYFKLFVLIFSYHFNMLMSKIIFFLKKIYYFNTFPNKKHFKNQRLPHFQTPSKSCSSWFFFLVKTLLFILLYIIIDELFKKLCFFNLFLNLFLTI